jgi:hypothetical protein
MPRGKNKSSRGGDGGDLFLINEVSRLVNLSQKRIREYEKEGFIKPLREKNTNNRLYSSFDVSQINQVNSLIHDRGFTLACLRNLMVLAPCWNVFDCQDKEECPAFQLPWRPCYEVREYRDTLCNGPCPRCAIYLNRNVKKEKILEKFPPEV